MRQTISFITLGVSDLPRSRAFYNALGWVESPASQPSVAFFQVGNIAFALFAREDLADDAGVSAVGSGFPSFALAHNVPNENDVDRLIAEAVAAGGKLIKAGERAAWGGFRGYFADPDGFLWEVCHNPFFPLDENGYIVLPK